MIIAESTCMVVIISHVSNETQGQGSGLFFFLHVANTSLYHHLGLGHPTNCNLRSGVRQLAYSVIGRATGWWVVSLYRLSNASGIDSFPDGTHHRHKASAEASSTPETCVQPSVCAPLQQGQERLLKRSSPP